MGERLQVHPTSVTSIVRRLVGDGLVVRMPHPDDGRGVLAEITPRAAAVVEAATRDLVASDFALEALTEDELTGCRAAGARAARTPATSRHDGRDRC